MGHHLTENDKNLRRALFKDPENQMLHQACPLSRNSKWYFVLAHACLTSGHAPNETAVGLQGDHPPYLDLDSLRGNLVASDAPHIALDERGDW